MTIYNGNRKNVLSFTTFNTVCILNQNVIQSFTVPGDPSQAYAAKFQYNGPDHAYIGLNADLTPLTLPILTPTQFARIEHRPQERYVKGGDMLSYVTPDISGVVVSTSLRELS